MNYQQIEEKVIANLKKAKEYMIKEKEAIARMKYKCAIMEAEIQKIDRATLNKLYRNSAPVKQLLSEIMKIGEEINEL